jgi:hypothetical protein
MVSDLVVDYIINERELTGLSSSFELISISAKRYDKVTSAAIVISMYENIVK